MHTLLVLVGTKIEYFQETYFSNLFRLLGLQLIKSECIKSTMCLLVVSYPLQNVLPDVLYYNHIFLVKMLVGPKKVSVL